MKPLITFSKLRTKVLNHCFNYYTLSEFIYKLHQKNFNKKEIDFIDSKFIILSLLKNLHLKHFYYLDESSKIVDDLVNFLISVKRNRLNLDSLDFSEDKKEDLKIILDEYNNFLKDKDLADLGDIERSVLDFVKKEKVEVLSDKFEIFNVHFFTSKLQKDIFDNLDKEFIKYTTSNKLKNQYLLKSFNEFEEVKNALKLVNELLEKNDLKDIKIVVSDIDKYFPIFEALFNEYNLLGYSTKGKRIIDLDENLKRVYEKNIDFEIESIKKRLEKLGINVKEDRLKKEFLEKRVLFKNGIEITETNQIFVYDNIKHLIFVGADLESFPPKRDKNIFYFDGFEEVFYLNNLYTSSKDIYSYMKLVSENLYITYPEYKGKSKNSLSFIIDRDLKEYKPTKKADIELLKEKKRVKIDSIEEFLKDLEDNNLDEYNGKTKGIDSIKLSVSKLNSYIKCRRKFFYSYVLKLSAPIDESKELEFTTQGNMMHKAFEMIVKENSDFSNIDINSYAKRAYKEILEKEGLEENIFTKLYFEKLIELIEKFVNYLQKNNIKNSKTEVEFYLDENLKISDENNYFLKGFIDRLDEGEIINIVDYKSSKKDGIDTSKIKEIEELKDLQLGVYTYYAKEKYKKEVKASLLTFNTKEEYVEFATLKMCDKPEKNRNKPQYACYNDKYEKDLIDTINNIRDSIKNGDFLYNDEDEEVCEYCDFELICKRF